jgi:hypothetical protein
VLDVPLRDRNDLLVSAGYAPTYRATALDTPAMACAGRSTSCCASRSPIRPSCSTGTGTSSTPMPRQGAWSALLAGAVTELGGNDAAHFHPDGFRLHGELEAWRRR